MDYWKEGHRIAREIGHGVVYNGPQLVDDEFLFHMFTDEEATGTTFGARTLEEAKAKLMEKRQQFGAAPVAFPEIFDPLGILDAFKRDLDRIMGSL